MEPISTTQAHGEASGSPGPKFFRLALAAAWTVVICVLCWMPGDMVRRVEGDSSWFQVPNLDKVVHWGIFVVFAVLWVRVGTGRGRYIAVVLAGLAMAILTEVVQGLPAIGRDGEVGDAVTDLIGVGIGLAVARWLEPALQWAESMVLGTRAPRSIGGVVDGDAAGR